MVMKYLAVLLFLSGFAIGGVITSLTMPEDDQCDCTVNINGSIMSVEDGFYYLIEGLSADQADEVQIMINNSCECCK
jgi:hypothetical protein